MLNTEQIITSTAEISDNISALPAGIIRHPKPLSNNHYILTSDNTAPAEEVSWRILQGRIANKDPEKQFIIAALENHETISHISYITNLLTRFSNHQKAQPDDPSRQFIYAVETPYNLLYHVPSSVLPEEQKYRPDLYDPDNRILMKFLSKYNVSTAATLTNKALFNTCVEHGIRTYFNDAARIKKDDYLDPYDPILDPNDHITAKIAKENHGITLSDRLILCEEEDGMSIRNDVMAELALSEAGKGDVIIQSLGIDHGGSKVYEDSSYEKSYLKLCRNKGAEVTSIFFSTVDDNYSAERVIPDQALIDDPDMIIIDGMPEYNGIISSPLVEYIKARYLRYRHNDSEPTSPNNIEP